MKKTAQVRSSSEDSLTTPPEQGGDDNPARAAVPPIEIDDVIYAVNRQVPTSFSESISLLKSCNGTTVLVMLRRRR